MVQRHSLQRGQYVPEYVQSLCLPIGHCLGPEKHHCGKSLSRESKQTRCLMRNPAVRR
jgi:hypothetical protein